MTLSALPVKGSVAEALGKSVMLHLREIVLNNNALGEAGGLAVAEALGKGVAKQLHSLELDNNKLGDRSAQALAAAICAPGALPSLPGIFMEGNGVGEAGRRALDEAVQSTGRRFQIMY